MACKSTEYNKTIRNIVLWARYKLFWFYLSNFPNSFSDNEAKISVRDQWFLSWPTETVIIVDGALKSQIPL